MAWFEKKKPAPARWDCAREITKAEAENDKLPPGWYIYPDDDLWYGIRPGSGGLERSSACHSPKELTQWLGIPVPEPLLTVPQASPSLDELVRQTIQPVPPLSGGEQPPAAPQPRADENLAEQPERKQPPPKKSGGRTRNNELNFWVSDAELKRFRLRVQKSGLNQSEFLRRAALTGRILVEDKNPISTAALDDLEQIRAELGRQGGMLKMVIKPNQGQRELHPEEWAELVKAIRYLEHTKERLGALEEKINGNCQA